MKRLKSGRITLKPRATHRRKREIPPREFDDILEESVERELRRWARRLWLVLDGEASRKLTKDEIEIIARPPSPKARSRRRRQ